MIDRKFKAVVDTAIAWSKASTCVKKHVGAVIFDINSMRILSTGFNGSPSGECHCYEKFDIAKCGRKLIYVDNIHTWSNVSDSEFRNKHHVFAERYEVHAEQNAILNLIKTNTNINIINSKLGLVCTLEPCYQCAKFLLGLGVQQIYYIEPYSRTTNEDRQYLKNRIIYEEVNSDYLQD